MGSHSLITPLTLSLAISLVPWGKYFLYPFKLFTTWVHECCHALAAVVLGGSVRKITLSADTSGLTYFQIPPCRIRQSLVASAGYLGSSAAGCLIYYASASYAHHARLILLGTGALMLLSLLLWIRNLFGALVALILGAGLIALTRYPPHPKALHALLPFLGIQTGLNSLYDVRTLFSLDRGARSDAQTMQSLLGLPAGFWAVLWMSLSLASMAWTVCIVN